MRSLVVRCEATPSLGTGHALRCLALAEEWLRREGRVTFVMAAPEPAVVTRLRTSGIAVETIGAPAGERADAQETAALARRLGTRWVVVDGPDFGEDWEAAWPQECGLLRVDDNGLERAFRADLLLNQNLGAAVTDYPRAPTGCRCLLGPSFALLRPEFTGQLPRPRGNRAVVTMGGSDPARATERVFGALLDPAAVELEADFVIGAANPRRDELVRAIAAHRPRLKAWVAPDNLPELFATARFAVCAGGTTLYELSLLRTPLFVLCTAENQRRTCERFSVEGAAFYAGWHGDLAPSRLAVALASFAAEPMKSGPSLVDGLGAQRVIDAMIGGGA